MNSLGCRGEYKRKESAGVRLVSRAHFIVNAAQVGLVQKRAFAFYPMKLPAPGRLLDEGKPGPNLS